MAKVFEEKTNDFPFLTDLLHSNNRTGDNAVHLFENSKTKYYPDFYCCGELGLQKECARKGFVLDAKYKRLCTVGNEETDVSQDDEPENGTPKTGKGVTYHYKREDLFQMLAYMHCLKAQKAVLISPYRDLDCKGLIQTPDKPKKALGYGGEISIVAVPIPANETQWDDFVAKMQNVEKELVKKIEAQIEK